jgi:predicted RNA-binding Zn-ribbon protein involved in translation (DUF1610 family)
MAFDAPSQQMKCPYCGHTAPVPPRQQQAPAGAQTDGPAAEGQAAPAQAPAPVGAHQERSLQEGLQAQAQQAGQGYGTPVQTMKCQTCGATVSFAGTEVSKNCDFCGSQHVLEQESHRRVITPQSLVPFGVDEAKAKQSFKGWLGGLWFRPSDLKKKARVGAINGVYIPYWTFDAQVYSQWRAEAGHYYYEQEAYTDANGQKKTRQVKKTRWEPAAGQRQDVHDDVLIVASQGLSRPIAHRLSTFDTSKLVPYDPQYLAGWRAEEYAVELQDAWQEAQQKIEQEQRNRCASDVPGDTQRSLQVQNQFSGETFKHVLLPLWIASYRYGGKPYQFLVNGQTGEVKGEAPLSWVKIILFILTIVAIIAAIVLATR